MRTGSNLVWAIATILGIGALCLPLPCLADVPLQSATVGVLGTSTANNFSSSYLIDMNRRDPVSNCPYVYLLMPRQALNPEIPPVRQNRTYPATVSMSTTGTPSLHAIVIGGVSYNAGLTQTWVCDKRPAPDGGHWEWENNNFFAKPGVADPVRWQPAEGQS